MKPKLAVHWVIIALQIADVLATESVTLSDWQKHAGVDAKLGPDGWQSSPSYDAERDTDKCPIKRGQHGDKCLYDYAQVPPPGDKEWNNPPDLNIINMQRDSLLCDAPVKCYQYLDFTYFQAFLDMPQNCTIQHFTVDFDGMDDGSRVEVNGVVDPDSYVYLNEKGTANLKQLIVPGQKNRIVISQGDDCCKFNNLKSAVVTLKSSCETMNCTSVPDICNDFPTWIKRPHFDTIVCSGGSCNVKTCCMPATSCREENVAVNCAPDFENSYKCDPDETSPNSCASVCCIPVPSVSPTPSTTGSPSHSASASQSLLGSPSPTISESSNPSASPSMLQTPSHSGTPSSSMKPSPSSSPINSVEQSPSTTPKISKIPNENAVQHNGTYHVNNTVQHNRTFSIEDTVQHNGTFAIQNTIQHNGTFSIQNNVQYYGTFAIENTVQHNGTFHVNNTVQHNRTFSIEDTVQHNRTFSIEHTVQNYGTFVIQNTIQHNGTFSIQNTVQHYGTFAIENT
ncbi:hypothetical protein SARC_11709, partial [Sphaeroforma arctica JP610]